MKWTPYLIIAAVVINCNGAEVINERSAPGEMGANAKKNLPIEQPEQIAKLKCDDIESGVRQERIRYQSSAVAFGADCLQETQSRTCTEGAFSTWSGSFESEECTIGQAKSCQGGIAHGKFQTRTRFKALNVGSSELCVDEEQKSLCENGSFKEWSGSFTHETCKVASFKNCGSTPHGNDAKRTRFEKSSVRYNETCNSQEQTKKCFDGELVGNWSGSFSKPSCTVETPLDCGTVKHGDMPKRTRFQTLTVPFGSTCKSQEQTGTCTNGDLSWTGSYVHPNCQILPEPEKLPFQLIKSEKYFVIDGVIPVPKKEIKKNSYSDDTGEIRTLIKRDPNGMLAEIIWTDTNAKGASVRTITKLFQNGLMVKMTDVSPSGVKIERLYDYDTQKRLRKIKSSQRTTDITYPNADTVIEDVLITLGFGLPDRREITTYDLKNQRVTFKKDAEAPVTTQYVFVDYIPSLGEGFAIGPLNLGRSLENFDRNTLLYTIKTDRGDQKFYIIKKTYDDGTTEYKQQNIQFQAEDGTNLKYELNSMLSLVKYKVSDFQYTNYTYETDQVRVKYLFNQKIGFSVETFYSY